MPHGPGEWGGGGEREPWALALGTGRCQVLQDSLISQDGGWCIQIMALTSEEAGEGRLRGCPW